MGASFLGVVVLFCHDADFADWTAALSDSAVAGNFLRICRS